MGKELDSNGKLDRTIIFVGDKMFGRDLNKLLAEDFGITDFREFFEGEHKGTLDRFAKGELDLLIACKRISEGLDIKTVETIILFSSDSVRETIEIGRALRLTRI